MPVIAQFLPAFYFYGPLMCLVLALAAAVGVSLPRHKWRIGRLLVAIFTSTAIGAVVGFVATYTTGKLCFQSPGGNDAQAGVLLLLVMVVVSPLTAFVTAKAFPVVKQKPSIMISPTRETRR